ncbi:hypothetical protein EGR_10396 [Echinococcus granulosus]|uniref:Uncharacterized protein n=1 Tax=Echinococcus granulosus TaxID=6210 RepID=W6U2H6_ECHGR|nr:hypothetical protein EGR_10396 [Echinococcus granulosus]EUB54756.1 hypothetical protein EGR_10396 [Echinococcus granulosus]
MKWTQISGRVKVAEGGPNFAGHNVSEIMVEFYLIAKKPSEIVFIIQNHRRLTADQLRTKIVSSSSPYSFVTGCLPLQLLVKTSYQTNNMSTLRRPTNKCECPTIMLAASAQDNSTGLNDFSVTLFEDTFLYGGMCSYKMEQVTFSLKKSCFKIGCVSMHVIKAKHPYMAYVFNNLNNNSKEKVFWVKDVVVGATNIIQAA